MKDQFYLSGKPLPYNAKNSVSLIISKSTLLAEGTKVFFKEEDLQQNLLAFDAPPIHLGKLGHLEVYAFEALDKTLFHSKTRQFTHARDLLDQIDKDCHSIIFRALHLSHWNSISRYCGCCGGATRHCENENVKICSGCDNKFFPQYSPAVIMLVTKGDHLLLGRSAHFEKDMYSTLAGFIEAGESCEDAVSREVREEAGIQIHNIRQRMMQPWPFPNSLMFGYRAEYLSGELQIDNNELEDAKWFHYNELPKLPPKFTISTMLINEFVQERKLHSRMISPHLSILPGFFYKKPVSMITAKLHLKDPTVSPSSTESILRLSLRFALPIITILGVGLYLKHKFHQVEPSHRSMSKP